MNYQKKLKIITILLETRRNRIYTYIYLNEENSMFVFKLVIFTKALIHLIHFLWKLIYNWETNAKNLTTSNICIQIPNKHLTPT